MYIYKYIYIYVCMYVCKCVCNYGCMYVCIYLLMYIYTISGLKPLKIFIFFGGGVGKTDLKTLDCALHNRPSYFS